MDGNPLVDAFNELLPYFEAMDTRSAAILEYLKDKHQLTDEQFAPYLERAANGTNVKWLAARKRMEYQLSCFGKEAANPEERKTERGAGSDEEKPDARKDPEKKSDEKPPGEKPPVMEGAAEKKDAPTKGNQAFDNGGREEDKKAEEGQKKDR